MRYIVQMSPRRDEDLALYDLRLGAQVAHFKDAALAHDVKDFLNDRERADTEERR